MQLFLRHFRSERDEARVRPPDGWDGYFLDPAVAAWMHGSMSPETAMKVGAVFACVNLLSRSMASVPLVLYRRGKGDDRERDTAHPLSRILRLQPNRWQTHFDFVAYQVLHLLLRGNFYAQIVRDRAWRVRELVPLHPDRVTVEQVVGTGELQYTLHQLDGRDRVFPQRDILHVTGLSTDGITGVSPILAGARSMEILETTETHAIRVFRNNAVPKTVLKTPVKLSNEARERLKEGFQKAYSGENLGKTAVLEEGMDIATLSITAQDAQLIEQKYQSIEDVARVFGVPPHKIGHLLRSTFSNIEHQALEYVQDALLPWAKKIEEVMMVRLLSEREQDTHFIEFLLDALIRADIKTRYDAYNSGIQGGWLSANEVRSRENLNAIGDQGDIYRFPTNMIDAKKADELPMQKPAPTPTKTNDPDGGDSMKGPNAAAAKAQAKRSLSEIIARAVRKERNAAEKAEKRGDLEAWKAEFLPSHHEFVREILTPYVTLYSALTRSKWAEMADFEPLFEDFRDVYDWSIIYLDESERSAVLAERLLGLIEEE